MRYFYNQNHLGGLQCWDAEDVGLIADEHIYHGCAYASFAEVYSVWASERDAK